MYALLLMMPPPLLPPCLSYQKYLWRGILFKMSDGTIGPYNGSDEAAAKAAGHDLKGAIHYRNCGVANLHLPLMALIDYKGFRMSAQAFLPLGPGSLVYGSADGGKTVWKSNEEFNGVMEIAAERLNLCGHVVGRVGGLQLLHSAVDIGRCGCRVYCSYSNLWALRAPPRHTLSLYPILLLCISWHVWCDTVWCILYQRVMWEWTIASIYSTCPDLSPPRPPPSPPIWTIYTEMEPLYSLNY